MSWSSLTDRSRPFSTPGAGTVIETPKHGGNQKSGEPFVRIRSRSLRNTFFGLLRSALVAKTSLRSNWGGHLKMKRQIPNINIVRSAWRRVKNDIKEAIIRDLKPVKEVRGGRRLGGESKPSTREGTRGTTGGH